MCCDVTSFWKKWNSKYFPSLLVQKKWHHEKRNLSIGDIVAIQDSNLRVVKVFPGIDDKVRRIVVEYKNKNSDTFINIERSVRN